ncbi:MAG TPA: sugar phosphate isomerase/epimerase [Thermoproteales archaeon]|nr:sugar phosphate isomerase/epimerase [Thermoproteales archaeon]
MLLGFLTGGQLGSLDKTLEWAKMKGFQSISITLPLNQTFLNLNEIITSPKTIRELVEKHGVVISALGFYGNPLYPDENERKRHVEHFLKVLEATYRLEIPVMTGWVGKYPGSLEDNYREIEKVWPKIIKKAEDYGVKIAIENCPGNIMYRPDIWEKVFEILGSDNLGLEFDPSHLICQFIDANSVLDTFGDRVYHIHAKDAEINWEKVSRLGITSSRWCPHRLPGFGELDWAKFFTILKKHGYDYAISIEHEDPYFKDYKEGLLLAKKFLEQFFP